MTNTTRRWRLLVGCTAVAAAGICGPSAAADPQPVPSNPYGPVTAPAAPAAMPVTSAVTAGAPVQAPMQAPAPAQVAPNAVLPAATGTLRDYFAAHKVQLEPQQATGFSAFNITLPMPTGWTHVPDPNVPDAFAVLADRHSGSLYAPNAQLVVYRLVGQFDPKEAISHGYVDSQQQMAWQTTNASLDDFCGFPSSVIEGTYRDADMTLNTSRRHVIVPAAGSTYLVSLTVTTGAGRAIGAAPATDGIINGFRVSLPGAPPSP